MGRELIQEIEEVVKEVQPHFIFSHYHDDTIRTIATWR